MIDFLKSIQPIVSIVLAACSVLCSLIVFIYQIVKGKGSIIKTSMFSLLEKLPLFISDAESKGFADGASKLNYVVSLSCSYLASMLGLDYQAIYVKYAKFITAEIESILTTPQKKEVIQ